MILADGDIIIRPLQMDDAQALYEAIRESIPEVSRWLPWCHEDYAIEETREFIALRSYQGSHQGNHQGSKESHRGAQQEGTGSLTSDTRPLTSASSGEWYSFGIFDKETGRFLGGVGLNFVNRAHQIANLGYWVRTSATGRGIASRATRLAARIAFEELGLQRIEIVAAVGNLGSQRVAEKAGAVREGVLRKRLLIRGEELDSALFSLVREDLGEW